MGYLNAPPLCGLGVGFPLFFNGFKEFEDSDVRAHLDGLILNICYTLSVHVITASLHDRHYNFLLVNLAVDTRILQYLGPVNRVASLCFAEREDLLVHLLVRSQHTDKIPHIRRRFTLRVIKQIE